MDVLESGPTVKMKTLTGALILKSHALWFTDSTQANKIGERHQTTGEAS